MHILTLTLRRSYSTRYRPGLDLVLKDIDIKIVRDRTSVLPALADGPFRWSERKREDRYRRQDWLREIIREACCYDVISPGTDHTSSFYYLCSE